MLKYKKNKNNKLYYLLAAILLFCTTAASQQTFFEEQDAFENSENDPFGQLPMLDPPTVMETAFNAVNVNEPIPELFIETVTLKFLDAKSLLEVVDNMSSDYGSVTVNENNNSLIICDSRENLDKILAQIQKADKTPQQIVIEVVILDVQLNDDTEMGINWDILSSDRYNVEYRQNFTSSRIGTTVEDATTIGNGTAFNTTGLGGSFSVISSSVRHVVNLIQQKRDVEILASPRVMLVSGAKASIEAVEELPYTEVSDTASGGAGAITTTKFKNVGIQLNVGAALIDSNSIFLTVDVEQNVTTGLSDTEVPKVDTRRANSSLFLRDGQVVVFGGLRRQEKTKEIDQIPILGDLPIVGYLFKSINTIVKNSELIVFISPHVYMDEEVADNKMSKFKEITEKPLLSIPEDKNSSKDTVVK